MVPAQVQQRPAKSTAFPLPSTYPVPEVATTSILPKRIQKQKSQNSKFKNKKSELQKLPKYLNDN